MCAVCVYAYGGMCVCVVWVVYVCSVYVMSCGYGCGVCVVCVCSMCISGICGMCGTCGMCM